MADAPPHDPETGVILAPPIPVPQEAPASAPGSPPAALAPPTAAAAPPPAAKLPRPPSDSVEIGAAVKQAQAQLAEAAGSGAFARDPYRLVLAGLSTTLGVFPTIVRRIEDALSTVAVELGALVRTVRHPLTDAERATLRREVVDTIDRAARDSVGAAAASLPRAMNLRSLALAGSASVVALAVVGTGAFYAGRASASGEARAVAAAQRADLTVGQEQIAGLPLAEARAWVLLIRANPAVREALAKTQGRQADATGRPFGMVPLWLDIARVPPTGR